jgi:hypothetical protein
MRAPTAFVLGIAMVFLVPSSIQAANTICVGEAVSGRAISNGYDGDVDSAIGANGDNCLFAAESSIGRKIGQVCRIRDTNSSDEPGPTCRVEAIVRKGVIVRVLGVTKLNTQ